MSIFGKIMSAIFGREAEAATPVGEAGGGASFASGAAPGSALTSRVDVAAILDKAVAAKKERLPWRLLI